MQHAVYDPHRVGKIKVELLGRDVKAREIEGYTVRALPTRQWGYVVITTPDGVLDHEEARLFSLDIFAIQTLWKGREEFFNGVAACKNVSNF
ncbi:hypothetical protein CUMW_256700 [Citrus unshiu]|uniref:Uncharacterized protein n=1 Tax=Citrus unshiu TaxID=55188 RepID=A0A2H5QS68_CITUN|nr:hypothetical protein CUMW_256700 [Citrus unshiu]